MEHTPSGTFPPQRIDRYVLHAQIAQGGMASVHLGRLVGPDGFGRTVAIKQLHPHLLGERGFVAMLLDEGRLAARLRHPNVVHILDVVRTKEQVLLVMEYVHGLALSTLLGCVAERGERVPVGVAVSVLAGVLHGLHAAHEAVDERGAPLGIVHRDVSPQNVLVGADGVGRVVDFGVAKAAGRISTTREGALKGKLAYMAPEQLDGRVLDRRTDVYAASIVLWELVTASRLFAADTEAAVLMKVMNHQPTTPSQIEPDVPGALDAVVLRGLRRDPELRFQTARDMALALEQAVVPAPASAVARWIETTARELLAERAARVAKVERRFASIPPPTQTLSSIDVKPASIAPAPLAAGHDPRTSRAAIALALVGAIALIMAIVLLILAPRLAPAEPIAAPSAPLPTSPLTPQTGAQTGGESSADPRVASTAAPSMTIAAPIVITAAPSSVATAAPHTPHRVPIAKPPARPTCDPPYVLDANGVKRYKLGCL